MRSMPPKSPDEYVDAQPTKEFFVRMLVKDIDLVAAICDLIDNSVDAARENGKGSSSDRHINLTVNESQFRIDDNCGGMSVEDAKSYAFRFGRPDEPGAEPGDHAIGLFGVGMKRALFKLGRRFIVRSDNGQEAFEVRVNVDQWIKQPKWAFPLTRTDHMPQAGTSIRVSELHEAVSEEFGLERFRSELALEVGRRHQAFIGRGLRIKLNNHVLKGRAPTLREPGSIRSAYVKQSTNSKAPALVTRIYCGLDESVPRDAGWYIFCNERLVLGADKTEETGWGARRGLPRYHNQYAHFRGYVFFDSDDPRALPWTTTKMGLDVSAPAYRAARNTMFTLMQPVMKFLNDIKNADREEMLADAVAKAEPIALNGIKERPAFQGLDIQKITPGPEQKKIQYYRPLDQIQRVQRALGVTTLTAVGEETFDYFYEAECDE